MDFCVNIYLLLSFVEDKNQPGNFREHSCNELCRTTGYSYQTNKGYYHEATNISVFRDIVSFIIAFFLDPVT